MIGVVQDITERKRIEEALREESHHLEVLNRTGSMLASKLELETLLQTVTDAATELSGAKFGAFFYNRTDDSGESYMLYTLSGAPREAFEKFDMPRATPLFGPTFRGEQIIRCDDVSRDPRYGQWEPFQGMPPGHLPVRSYLAVPVVSRSGTVIGGLFFGHPKPGVFTARAERLLAGIAAQAAVAIDNARLYETAQQAAASERAARADIERSSDLKDEFLANLSHELRTPLTAILGWAQMLRRRSNLDEADIREGLEIIERNSRLQVQLIDDLLDTSRITSGKLRIDVQPVDPKTIVEAALETIQPAAEAKGIRIEKILDPAAGPVSGDPGRLQQVMWNLLSNAIKFTPKQGKVQVLLERVNSHIEISVTDTGIGFKPEFLAHVFERFRQADGSTTRRHGGLGLGLSIVKHLVELHGGTVRAASPGEGKGATFTIHLPLALVHRKPEARERLHPKAPRTAAARDFKLPDLSGIRVLVVDDEVDGRDLVRFVLEDCGAEVVTAESGKHALDLLAQRKPDVIVSDIGMPEMDGYEFIKLAQQRTGRRIPAIALTAFARSEDRTRALQAGFIMHVAKPVEADEFLASVASIVASQCG
jgi:signal transduction histidine kinase/ActR/RegA family two-component response regulator